MGDAKKGGRHAEMKRVAGQEHGGKVDVELFDDGEVERAYECRCHCQNVRSNPVSV